MSSSHDTRQSSLAETASANDEKRSGELAGKPQGKAPRGSDAEPRAQGSGRDMGSALRTVYQRAVEEAVPAEMLDLLGKLD